MKVWKMLFLFKLGFMFIFQGVSTIQILIVSKYDELRAMDTANVKVVLARLSSGTNRTTTLCRWWTISFNV